MAQTPSYFKERDSVLKVGHQISISLGWVTEMCSRLTVAYIALDKFKVKQTVSELMSCSVIFGVGVLSEGL
jgi:hypothetical protein